jgi:hypothetical protein
MQQGQSAISMRDIAKKIQIEKITSYCTHHYITLHHDQDQHAHAHANNALRRHR